MENERSHLKSQIEAERQRADKASQQLSNYHKADRKGTLVVKCEIETQRSQSDEKVHQLQLELDKVWEPGYTNFVHADVVCPNVKVNSHSLLFLLTLTSCLLNIE